MRNPLKTKCSICGTRPIIHNDCDGNFYACNCKTKNGYLITTYYGWDLPKQWKMNWYYRFRYWLSETIQPK